MVARYVSACSSLTHKDGVHLYSFLKDPSLKVTKSEEEGISRHILFVQQAFWDSCFKPYSKLSLAMGLKRKTLLKPDAVPTTLLKNLVSLKRKLQVSEPETQLKKRRTAYERCERASVSK